MKTIIHTKNWGSYSTGVASSWPDEVADNLVGRGIAIYQAVKPPVRNGGTDRMVKKEVRRPTRG